MTQHQAETSRPVIGYLVVLSVVSLINLCLVIDARCQLRAATEDQVNAVAREVLRLLEPQTIHRRQAKRHSEEGPSLPAKGSAPSRSSTEGVSFNVNGTRHSSAPEFYATVPMDVMTRFCKDSTTYCSSEYVRGEKGDLGPIGPPGLKGSKGEPGLDGIDGSPGQPGLDGILGAQGADGPKGDKGDKGDNGIPGTHGIDGINGINGIPGEKGDKGDTGYPGLRGQRGLKGDQGERGEAGIPGIQTWMPKNSDLKSAADVLIPPQIVLSPESSSVEVTEGVSLSLMCSASGQPSPKVSWSRIDGKPIFGNPHVSSVEDKQLNISLVTRADMGVYVCTAANGIPPLATRTISLNVAFAPLIRIQKWNVASWNGGGVVLECLTEAYPPPVNFWISRSGNIIESSLKYVPSDETLSSYQHRMTLNITYVTPSDLGSYLCVSKNVRGQAVGTIDLSNQNEPLDWRSSSEEATFGTEAKEKQHMQCLRRCPECRCKSALPEMADVRNEYSDVDKRNWTRKPDRNPGCNLDSRLSRVGKPVMYLENGTSYSAWWQDEVYHPDSENATRVFYATKHGDYTHLYMFKSRELFQNGTTAKSIPLISPFHGNGNLLVNGTFYYHQNATNNIVRVPLHSRQGEMSVLAVEDMAFSNRTFLFGQQQNYAMISADENGLWIIYSSIRSNNTMILKIDEKTFEKQFIWNLTLPHKKIGQMFIMCGVLYAVNSVTEPNAQIYSYAYDLIADTIISLEAPIAFTNPFANTTFLTYNPREHELFSTDNGNHLVYPVRTLEEDRRAELLEVQLRTA